MKTLEWTDARSADEVLQQSQQQDVIVTRNGQPVALVMALEDDDADWIERELDPEFIASIERAREDFKAGRTIRHEDLKRKFGLE